MDELRYTRVVILWISVRRMARIKLRVSMEWTVTSLRVQWLRILHLNSPKVTGCPSFKVRPDDVRVQREMGLNSQSGVTPHICAICLSILRNAFPRPFPDQIHSETGNMTLTEEKAASKLEYLKSVVLYPDASQKLSSAPLMRPHFLICLFCYLSRRYFCCP